MVRLATSFTIGALTGAAVWFGLLFSLLKAVARILENPNMRFAGSDVFWAGVAATLLTLLSMGLVGLLAESDWFKNHVI